MKFWIAHNQSKSYSSKLNGLFQEATKLLSKHPYLGRRSDIEGVRVKLVRNYQIFYDVKDQPIHILTLWDTNLNPERLNTK